MDENEDDGNVVMVGFLLVTPIASEIIGWFKKNKSQLFLN